MRIETDSCSVILSSAVKGRTLAQAPTMGLTHHHCSSVCSILDSASTPRTALLSMSSWFTTLHLRFDAPCFYRLSFLSHSTIPRGKLLDTIGYTKV